MIASLRENRRDRIGVATAFEFRTVVQKGLAGLASVSITSSQRVLTRHFPYAGS
jgi:hypothetical protein